LSIFVKHVQFTLALVFFEIHSRSEAEAVTDRERETTDRRTRNEEERKGKT